MSNEIYKDNISEELITKELYTKNTPDPDLVIRTSGEKRILIFFEENWPDFGRENLIEAIIEYS